MSNYKKTGFTLGVTLILITIISLLTVAAISIITKKSVPVPKFLQHGAYICYIKNDNTVVEEYYNSTTKISSSTHGISGAEPTCSFTPKDGVKLYKIALIGAGADGVSNHNIGVTGSKYTGSHDPIVTSSNLREPKFKVGSGWKSESKSINYAKDIFGQEGVDEVLKSAFNGKQWRKVINGKASGNGSNIYYEQAVLNSCNYAHEISSTNRTNYYFKDCCPESDTQYATCKGSSAKMQCSISTGTVNGGSGQPAPAVCAGLTYNGGYETDYQTSYEAFLKTGPKYSYSGYGSDYKENKSEPAASYSPYGKLISSRAASDGEDGEGATISFGWLSADEKTLSVGAPTGGKKATVTYLTNTSYIGPKSVCCSEKCTEYLQVTTKKKICVNKETVCDSKSLDTGTKSVARYSNGADGIAALDNLGDCTDKSDNNPENRLRIDSQTRTVKGLGSWGRHGALNEFRVLELTTDCKITLGMHNTNTTTKITCGDGTKTQVDATAAKGLSTGSENVTRDALTNPTSYVFSNGGGGSSQFLNYHLQTLWTRRNYPDASSWGNGGYGEEIKDNCNPLVTFGHYKDSYSYSFSIVASSGRDDCNYKKDLEYTPATNGGNGAVIITW